MKVDKRKEKIPGVCGIMGAKGREPFKQQRMVNSAPSKVKQSKDLSVYWSLGPGQEQIQWKEGKA